MRWDLGGWVVTFALDRERLELRVQSVVDDLSTGWHVAILVAANLQRNLLELRPPGFKNLG
jgi:hypothetical protein